MHTTPVSLLERLRRPGDHEAYVRFAELYTPLLYYWARRRLGLDSQQAADLVQDVFVTLLQKLPHFVYDPTKTFRGWLRTVLLNKWREIQRRPRLPTVGDDRALDQVASHDEAVVLAEDEYRRELVRRALELLRPEFQPATWKAFWEYAVSGKPVAQVASALGVTPNAVYLARARVLRRLRQELDGLLDDKNFRDRNSGTAHSLG